MKFILANLYDIPVITLLADLLLYNLLYNWLSLDTNEWV